MNSMKIAGRKTLAWCVATLILAGASAFADGTNAPVTLFNGKDLTGWKTVGGKGVVQWVIGKAAMDPDHPTKIKMTGRGDELICPIQGVNLTSEQKFGDCLVELEFMVGKHTPGNSVDSNSGIKMMDIYEIQIFDSAGVEHPSKIDCGAVYSETPPLLDACKQPGEWQKLVIDFRAPRFDDSGKKIANAKFVKVTLNGKVVQDNVEIAHGTNVGRNAPEHPTGSIYLQGDHGSVAFRNVKVTPL